MFSNMRATTKWDIDGPLLWGFFFTDLMVEKLDKAATRLVDAGYRFVQIYKADDGCTYVLHVERIELHTARTLYARNFELEELARDCGLKSYDGMDVGMLVKNS